MTIEVISLIGILIGLVFLIVAAFKGYSILVIAPLGALIVTLFSGEDIISFLKTVYLPGFGNFAVKNFLLFLTSAIFGKLIGDCGAAKYLAYKLVLLARRFPGREKLVAILSLVIVNALLTVGGISLYVVVFTLVSVAKNMFEQLDIPWRHYTLCTLGSSTFTMSMIPGNPSVQNLIPIEYLGTTASSAPLLGFLSALFCVALGVCYIVFSVRQTDKSGEGFLPSGGEIAKVIVADEEEDIPRMNLIQCLLPSILLLVLLNVFKLDAFVALAAASLFTWIIFRRRFENIKRSLAEGAANALTSIGNVCAVTGFGSVVAATAGYTLVLGALDKIPGPPIIQLCVAVNIVAGITGSASGGLGIALGNLTDRFLEMGISPEVMHRLSVMSSGCLDSLPHNGSVINNLTVTRLYHKYGYKHYFVLTVLLPILCTVFACVLVMLGIG